MIIKCECGGTYVKEARCRTWYCNRCYKHVKTLRLPKPQNVRSLQSYYRKKGLQLGYLSIKQAAKLKGCTFTEINRYISLFDIKIKRMRTVIIYNHKFISWLER